MTTPTPTTTEHAALAALRTDVLTLTPTAARWACIYIASIALPDVWATALLRDLDARAGTEPWPDLYDLVGTLGRPGHWTAAAFVGDGAAVRMWLAAVQAIAAAHAPSPPPAC